MQRHLTSTRGPSAGLTHRFVALALVATACDVARGPATDVAIDLTDGGADGPAEVSPGDTDGPVEVSPPEPDGVVAPQIPAPIEEPFGQPIPDAMYPLDWDARTCTIGDHTIPLFGADALDDCRICQCTWRGGLCARRAGCARDVCVFADGTTAVPGELVRVAGCYVCTCDADGGRCARDAAAPCPADGCLAPYPGEARTVAFGQGLFVSECHECTCDAERGTTCVDRCHPVCFPWRDRDSTVDDQARVPADDGACSCVCDYGDMRCDPRGCDPECGVTQCAGD
ncbi:MAG: hypothetical protein IT385_00210 [Deltaproteobacteria bacterium]|nr:hypothetical protein [Deltaproteobacteria bacterium]